MWVRTQLRLPSTLSDTVYLLQGPPVRRFPLGFTLTQSHKLRWEAGGGLYCHTNKHMHKQDPEKVQWESRCHFSHVVLMGAWRVNILITFFFSNSPVLVLLRLFTWTGRWEIDGFGALTDSSLGAPLWSSLRELSITITSNRSKMIEKNGHCCHGYSFEYCCEPATL